MLRKCQSVRWSATNTRPLPDYWHLIRLLRSGTSMICRLTVKLYAGIIEP